MMQTISRIAVLAAMLLGLAMVVMGGAFIVMGQQAKGEIRDALVQEQVFTSQDATEPGVLVQDARTAEMQQDVIESHTFGRWGPYSQMDREDPNRETYLNGLTIRNSLNLAVVGFGVADLATAAGVISIVLGVIIAALAIPVHYLVTQMARQPKTRSAVQGLGTLDLATH